MVYSHRILGVDNRSKRVRDSCQSVLFLGTENLGRVVTPLSSVGTYVATEEAYDVYLVRQVRPPEPDFLDPHTDFTVPWNERSSDGYGTIVAGVSAACTTVCAALPSTSRPIAPAP